MISNLISRLFGSTPDLDTSSPAPSALQPVLPARPAESPLQENDNFVDDDDGIDSIEGEDNTPLIIDPEVNSLAESFVVVESTDNMIDDTVIRAISTKLEVYPRTHNLQPEHLGVASHFQEMFFNFEYLHRKGVRDGRLKIKLLLVQTGIWPSLPKRVNRRVASLVQPLFGLTHAGLQIGPWIIDWNSSSLIVPRPIQSTSPLIFVDVGNGFLDTAADPSLLQKVCEKIVEWNAGRTYDRLTNNCQSFVVEMLNCLGMGDSIRPDSPLGEFLAELRQTGTGAMTFRNPIWPETKTFQTHYDLDIYVDALEHKLLWEKGENLEIHYPDHYTLLKAFDRAFWLMHKRASNRHIPFPPECVPWTDAEKNRVLCPFERPDLTGSMNVSIIGND